MYAALSVWSSEVVAAKRKKVKLPVPHKTIGGDKFYYLRGSYNPKLLHREDGPAVSYFFTGRKLYFLWGIHVDKEDLETLRQARKNNKVEHFRGVLESRRINDAAGYNEQRSGVGAGR